MVGVGIMAQICLCLYAVPDGVELEPHLQLRLALQSALSCAFNVANVIHPVDLEIFRGFQLTPCCPLQCVVTVP